MSTITAAEPSVWRNLLILCKTYPSPSSSHVETSCVAGVDEQGQLLRIFPVPFRMVESDQQFSKWQWIRARIKRAQDDNRPESHRISVDTIELLERLSTDHHWAARRHAINSVKVYNSFDALEAARQQHGISLGLVRPSQLLDLLIAPQADPNWTADDLKKLLQEQSQIDLFDSDTEAKKLKTLKKLPFNFHYKYRCADDPPDKINKHKIVDWEAGALYWNICRKPNWRKCISRSLVGRVFWQRLAFLDGNRASIPQPMAHREPVVLS